MRQSGVKDIIVVAVTVLLLCGAGLDGLSWKKPPEADAYHENVRDAAGLAPLRIGDWVGQDVPVPKAALQLLRPNVIISRRFTSFVTARSVDLLLVQCSDARDLDGHYPPICYPNQGWKLVSHEPMDWKVEDWTITGTEYKFALPRKNDEKSEYVDNFMILPNGSFSRDISGVEQARRDLMRRFFGAAQVQIIFDEGTSPQERMELVQTLVSGNRAVIDTIRTGARSR